MLHPTLLLQHHTHQQIKTESSPKKKPQKTHNILLNKVRTTIILASCLCEPSSYNPLKINFQQSSDKQTDVSVSHRYKHSHGPSTPLNLHHIKLSNGGRETSEKWQLDTQKWCFSWIPWQNFPESSKCRHAQLGYRLKQIGMMLHKNKPNPHLPLEVHKGLVCSD